MALLKQTSIPILSADKMKEVDQLAIEHGLLLLQMMEHAALHMARHIQARFPNTKTVLILVGKGNNGADGIACARHLQNWGYTPIILLSYPKQELSDAAQHHLHIAELMRTTIHYSDEPSSAYLFAEADLIIDALIGYDLSGNPREPLATLIRQANGSYKPVISFDTPSGLDITTGKAYPDCIKADETLTLGLPKSGLLEAVAKEYTGELFLIDLGIPHFIYEQAGITVPAHLFSIESRIQLSS